jgi:3-oxoacyl-[acyl-carrier protein] reductase
MRNVVVSGGSRGLGLGICRRLARVGYRVIAVARNDDAEFETVRRSFADGSQGALRFVPFDLDKVEAIPNMIKGIRREFGPIYGLVNNAAIGTEGLLATMHNTQIAALIRLNVLSPIILTKYAVRSMMAAGGGRIVNISSIIASTGFSGLAVYGSTKASLVGLTRSLAREVGRLGITVNAVAPGFMETTMTSAISDEDRTKVAGRSALRRLPEVDDVASAVEFLLGEGGRNVTGTVITVDAGSTA